MTSPPPLKLRRGLAEARRRTAGRAKAGALRIWHVGNWCIHLGQKYVESPFEAPSKDVEVVNYAQPFVLRRCGRRDRAGRGGR